MCTDISVRAMLRVGIPTKSSSGWTPVYLACGGGYLRGYLDVAAASGGGRLDVAPWLFEAGASFDTRANDNGGFTPMLVQPQAAELRQKPNNSSVAASMTHIQQARCPMLDVRKRHGK